MADDGDLHDTILSEAPVGLALIEFPGHIRWANSAYYETTGRDASILGTDIHTLGESDGSLAPAIRDAIDQALTSRVASTFRSIRASHRHQPGGIYLDLDIRPITSGKSGAARVLVVVREETERVDEHRRAQLFYSSFISSTNAIEITDAKGILVDVNPAFERIYGYTRAECIGRKPNLVRGRNAPPELFSRMWADLLDPERGFWSGELQNRDRFGRERPVFLTITAIRDENGTTTHYLGVAVDLLEQKSWERVAGHAERLASLGQLAAGVAHEINTPLANVMLATESLRRKTSDPWARGRLDTITGQVELAAKIVRGLLDFARRSDAEMAEVDLREVAHAAVEFLKGKQSANIEFAEEFPQDPVPVWGDRNQLMQVVTNLVNNGCDAMGGRGRVRVIVHREASDAELEVTDSGAGISAESLPHLFEPFYTTKSEGQGTGLGLAICHGIVQSHHGTIVARNLPDRGASFLVTLPLVTPRTDPAAP